MMCSKPKKFRPERYRSQSGFAFIIFIVAFLFLFVYGMVITKGDINFTERFKLSITLISATNAAANSAPGITSMYQSACSHLALTFDKGDLGGCAPTDFKNTSPPNYLATWTNVDSYGGSMRCEKIEFKFQPSAVVINVSGALQSAADDRFCVDITGCRLTNSIVPPFLTPQDYKLGSSACIAKPPAQAMLLVNFSKRTSEIFQGSMIPPVPFVLPEAQPGGVDRYQTTTGLSPVNDYPAVKRNALPYEWDPNVAGGARFSPLVNRPYIRPFGTKEYRRVRGKNNADPILSDTFANDIFIRSMPDVVVETFPLPLPTPDPDYSGSLPDPIQYMDNYQADQFSRRWASNCTTCPAPYTGPDDPSNFRWRHGVLTQQELAHRCFGPFKVWYQRMAQQIAYMLDAYGVPYGAMLYSNWVIPMMPLIPHQFRNHPAWPAAPPYGQKVLSFPVLGPDPVSLPGISDPPAGADYVTMQFGDPAGSDTSGTVLTKTKALDVLLQPMSICASHLDHEIDEAGGAPHVFTALPNAYDPSMLVTLDTNCANPSPQYPIIEYNSKSFPFRQDGLCYRFSGGPGTKEECRRVTEGGSPRYNLPGPLLKNPPFPPPPPPAPPPASEVWRDAHPAPSSDITHPWRWCPYPPNTPPSPGSPAIPNLATAMSSIRGGGFTKSGHFLNSGMPSGSCPANWESRVFSTVTSAPNPYPESSSNILDSFLSGGLLITKRIMESPYWTPFPEEIQRFVIIITDGAPTVSLRGQIDGCLNGCNHCAWLPPNPTLAEVPTMSPGSAPYSTAVREASELIHRMAEDGTHVIVALIDHDLSIGQQAEKDFFRASLRTPLCKDTSDPTKLNYQLCQGLGATVNQGLISVEEPSCAVTTCDEKAPPAPNIHEVYIRRNVGELFPQFQTRLFNTVAAEMSRLIEGYTLVR